MEKTNEAYDLAIDLFGKEQYEESLIQFKKAVLIEPGRARIKSNLGKNYLMLNEVDLAKETAKEGTELKAKDPYTHFIFAEILFYSDQNKDAMASLKKAAENIEFDPSQKNKILNLKAKILIDLESPHDAYHLLLKVLRSDEYNSDALTSLVQALIKLNRIGEAIDKIENYKTDLNPEIDWSEIEAKLKNIHATYSSNIEEATNNLTGEKSDWKTWLEIGTLHFYCGEHTKALEAFQKAKEIAPDEKEVHYSNKFVMDSILKVNENLLDDRLNEEEDIINEDFSMDDLDDDIPF